MKRRERTMLSAEAKRELEALDAALAGEKVPDAHARIGELAIALRDMRALPREEFADALDAQAARSLQAGNIRTRDAARNRFSRRRRRSAFVRARVLLLRPASGLALAAIVALAIAVPLLASGKHHPTARPLP